MALLKEYPLIQYLSEPSNIDWISILSNSHNVVKKTMQLVGASLAVILEESIPYVSEDVTIVGDIINKPFVKKISLMSLDAVIQTNMPFVLQKTSGVICSYLYDNIHDDIF